MPVERLENSNAGTPRWGSISSPGLSRSHRRNGLKRGFSCVGDDAIARRSGQRPGQRIAGERPVRPRRTRQNPHHNWVLLVELAGLEPAASWVRSRRSPALSLVVCRDSLWWRLGVRPAFSASFRPFRLGSGQGSKVLARSPVWPSYVRPTCRPSHNPPLTTGVVPCERARDARPRQGTDGCRAGVSRTHAIAKAAGLEAQRCGRVRPCPGRAYAPPLVRRAAWRFC